MKINDLYDAVYYINLEKRPDRRKKFWEQNEKFLDKNRTLRIEACDATKSSYPPGNEGEVALLKSRTAHAVSYSSAFVHALEKGYQKIFIFEDDAEPLFGDIETFFFYEEKAQALNYDMIYFGGWLMSKPEKVHDYFIKANGNVLCTQSVGFNYNKKVFESLAALHDFGKTCKMFDETRTGPPLPDGSRSPTGTDNYMSDELQTCTNSFMCERILWGQYEDYSDIEGKHVEKK